LLGAELGCELPCKSRPANYENKKSMLKAVYIISIEFISASNSYLEALLQYRIAVFKTMNVHKSI
jgi:hypothetical protein